MKRPEATALLRRAVKALDDAGLHQYATMVDDVAEAIERDELEA